MERNEQVIHDLLIASAMLWILIMLNMIRQFYCACQYDWRTFFKVRHLSRNNHTSIRCQCYAERWMLMWLGCKPLARAYAQCL